MILQNIRYFNNISILFIKVVIDIMDFHLEIDDHILYILANETAKLLYNKQKKLRKIKWTDGESNLDTDYSMLACRYCVKAWKLIGNTNNSYEKLILYATYQT